VWQDNETDTMESEAPAAEKPVASDEEVHEAVAVPKVAAAPVVQAYRARYNETIAPPGGPPSRVVRGFCSSPCGL
jgi:hypothetical protein